MSIEEEKQLYNLLDTQHKALYKCIRSCIDRRFDEIKSELATVEAHIASVTNDKTFQKILRDNLDKETGDDKTSS